MKLFTVLTFFLIIAACGGQPTEDIEDLPLPIAPVVGDFSLNGIQGGSDATNDAFLSNSLFPHVYWQVAENAVSYNVFIKDSSDVVNICSEEGVLTTDFNFSTCSLVEGLTYKAHVVGVGVADSKQAINAPFTFLVDGTAPVVSIDVQPTNPDNSLNPTFEFSVTESGSGLHHFECNLDSTVFVDCVSPYFLSSLTEASHTLDVRAVDNAGNIGLATSYSWDIDITGPGAFVISGVQGGADATIDGILSNGSNAHIYWAAATDASSYDIVIRNLADTVDVCSLQNTSATDFNFSSCNLSNEVLYLVKVTAKDSLGNSTAATNNSFSFVVDNFNGPVASIDVNPTNPSIDLNPSFEFSAIDSFTGVQSFECEIDAGGFAPCTSPHALNLTLGSHTFKVRAIDNAGHVGSEVAWSWDINAGAQLTISESEPYDFGNIDMGSSAVKLLTLTNVGSLSAVSIVGSGLAAPFNFSGGTFPGINGDCATSLNSLASCVVEVEYVPTANTSSSDTVVVDYSDGSSPLSVNRGIQGMGVKAAPLAIANLTVTNSLTTEIEISWTAPFDNYTPITDYIVEYKTSVGSVWSVFNDGVSLANSVSVSGLVAATGYDFRVKATNGLIAADSNIATGTTAPDNPFFDPSTYKAINIGGAVASQVVALENGTTVTLPDTSTVALEAGQVHSFTSALNNIIEADKPIFVAGRLGASGAGDNLKGNIVWGTSSWSGKEFIFNGTRNAPHKVTIYAFEDASVEMFENSVSIDTQSVLEGNNHTFTLANYANFKIVSTGFIIAYFYSNSSGSVVDPKPLLPASKEIIGFPSTSARVTSISSGNNYNLYHSNSVTSSGTFSEGVITSLGPQGTSSLYQSQSMRIIADDKIVANSNADSNGHCSAPFVPVTLMKKRYAINVEAEWVAFASLEPGDITMTAPDGSSTTLSLTRTGSNSNAPYSARTVNKAAGYRFESTVDFAAWYEPKNNINAADNDETVMFGYN